MNRTLIVFAGGVMAGLAAGILFSPGIGEEIREKIFKNTRGIIDVLLQKAEEGMDRMRSMKSDLSGKLPDVAEVLND